MGIDYYPQAFLEECKCIVKEKRICRYINDDLQMHYDIFSIDGSKPKTSLWFAYNYYLIRFKFLYVSTA